jgi:hypothetical protein
VQFLLQYRYTPAEEAEADDVALQLYARAGYDPAAFTGVYEEVNPTRAATLRTLADRLPPAAMDWIRPPLADNRRFVQLVGAANTAPARAIDPAADRLLTALPNCILPHDLPEQVQVQRQLQPPPVTVTPGAFEKGPRRPE